MGCILYILQWQCINAPLLFASTMKMCSWTYQCKLELLLGKGYVAKVCLLVFWWLFWTFWAFFLIDLELDLSRSWGKKICINASFHYILSNNLIIPFISHFHPFLAWPSVIGSRSGAKFSYLHLQKLSCDLSGHSAHFWKLNLTLTDLFNVMSWENLYQCHFSFCTL